MYEDFGPGPQGNLPVPMDWKAVVTGWARFAAARGAELERWQPGAIPVLLEVTRQLDRATAQTGTDAPGGSREKIAMLCGYIHSSAGYLHEVLIPPHEQKAHGAAQELDRAALQIIMAMDGDYGDLSAL